MGNPSRRLHHHPALQQAVQLGAALDGVGGVGGDLGLAPGGGGDTEMERAATGMLGHDVADGLEIVAGVGGASEMEDEGGPRMSVPVPG